MSRTALSPAHAELWTLPVATVHTASFVLAQTIAKTAVEAAAPMMAGFFGDPGTGKTHALQHYCATSGVESIYVTASTSPQRKEIYEEILMATTAEIPDDSSRGLRRRCNEVLAERRRILVVDEAQNLTLQWHNQLRNLHDDADADFALLLAGGTNAARTLQRDQQLWSRMAMRCTFTTLEGQELLNVLAQLHPVLANTEEELLLEVDARDCQGNLRNWTSLLRLALPLVGKTSRPDRLTQKVVRAVFALRGTL